MILKEISYQGFRNLSDARLEFMEDFNFIIGGNGSGKTNLLEAIFYVGLASSFRAKEERNLIRFDDEFLRVDAEANGKKAGVYLDRETKRLMLRGNEVRRLSKFIGWLDITFLSIEDIWLIRGAPVKRRYFLNWLIAKVSPTYLSHLIEYRRILKQRNKVLQLAQENGDVDLLEILDEQLIQHGNKIYVERKHNLPELQQQVATIGAEMGLDKLGFEYQSTCPDMKLDQNILNNVRDKEFNFGRTLVGPHRDDLLFLMNDRPLRYYASEGEERAAAISLKLAEAEILYSRKHERPILLLDEVGSELDQNRKQILLNLLKGQVFYASIQMPQFNKKGQSRQHNIFTMRRGTIEVS